MVNYYLLENVLMFLFDEGEPHGAQDSGDPSIFSQVKRCVSNQQRKWSLREKSSRNVDATKMKKDLCFEKKEIWGKFFFLEKGAIPS